MKFVRLFLGASLLASVPALHSQTLQIVSGHGQVIQEQFLALKPFALRAVDASGRPVPNIPITWSISPASAGTLTSPAPQTNAQGEASTGFFASSNQPGTSFVPATITASSPQGVVQFALVVSLSRGSGGNLVPLPFVQPLSPTQGSEIQGAAGSTLPGAVSVKVVAQGGISQGSPIPNVGLRVEPVQSGEGPTASCNGPGGIVVTDQNGVATCDLVLGQTPGLVQLQAVVGEYWPNLKFDLRITSAGTGCTVAVAPLGQSFAAAGGTGTISVTANQGCSWNATSSAPWVVINSGASGQGNGTITYSILANQGGQRSASVAVAGRTVTLTQAAVGTIGGASLAFSVPPALPGATTTLAYSISLTATGGTPPYRWSATAALPPGLALDAATGVMSGIPTAAGAFNIPVTVADAGNLSTTQTFTLVVTQLAAGTPALMITTSSFPAGAVGVPYQQAVTTTGGCINPFSGPPAITLASGSLPSGLALQSLSNGGFGVGGTPTAGGTYTFAIRATACNDSTTREYSMTIGGVTTGVPMTVAPLELSFSTTAGGVARPTDQTIAIDISGSPTNFGASATTTSGGNWLSVTPANGQTPASISVGIINQATLAPGSYRGTVTIHSQASNSPIVIPVSLSVAAPAMLTLSITEVRYEHTLGVVSSSEQTISVTSSSSGGAGIMFASTVTGASAWLSVVPTSAQAPSTVRVVANSAALLPGIYDGFVTFAPVNNPTSVQTLHARLTVVAPPLQPIAPVISAVTNAASFASGAIAPGEFITIFGTNLSTGAPSSFLLAPGGTLESQLGGTRVLFNDNPVPLIYVSPGQVSAIAPYSIASLTSTRIVIERSGVRSNPSDVAVADAAPGIFTIGGTTQGAIINEDGAVNGVGAAANAGSIVSIYATGAGPLTPPVLAGSVASTETLSRPVLPVAVQIGDIDAEVLYAGSAPGLLAGVVQLNVRVPQASARGNAVPVTLRIGTNRSIPATMAVQ